MFSSCSVVRSPSTWTDAISTWSGKGKHEMEKQNHLLIQGDQKKKGFYKIYIWQFAPRIVVTVWIWVGNEVMELERNRRFSRSTYISYALPKHSWCPTTEQTKPIHYPRQFTSISSGDQLCLFVWFNLLSLCFVCGLSCVVVAESSSKMCETILCSNRKCVRVSNAQSAAVFRKWVAHYTVCAAWFVCSYVMMKDTFYIFVRTSVNKLQFRFTSYK